jgi:hypothetical protein
MEMERKRKTTDKWHVKYVYSRFDKYKKVDNKY